MRTCLRVPWVLAQGHEHFEKPCTGKEACCYCVIWQSVGHAKTEKLTNISQFDSNKLRHRGPFNKYNIMKCVKFG